MVFVKKYFIVQLWILFELLPILMILIQFNTPLPLIVLIFDFCLCFLLFVFEFFVEFFGVFFVLGYNLIKLINLLFKRLLILIQPLYIIIFTL